MQAFIQIFKMDMKNLFKNIIVTGYNTAFAILMILILGFLFSGYYANPSVAYNYFAVTLLVFAMLNGAMTATNCFMERDFKKPNLRIIYSPVGSFSLYFSKIVTSALFDFICHLLVLAVLIPTLHLNFGGNNFIFIVLLMIPIEFASCALGVLFCCIFKTEEIASVLISTIVSVLAFLGGAFFSFDGMGGTLAFVSKLSPVKWLIDAFFKIIFDANLSPFLPLFIGSIIVSVLLVFGCSQLFKSEDYI